jgi:hypothetical protein
MPDEVMPRRFPPPWDIEEANASCFIVKDNNGQALAYVYFEQDRSRRTAANLLTRDEGRRTVPISRNCRSCRRGRKSSPTWRGGLGLIWINLVERPAV